MTQPSQIQAIVFQAINQTNELLLKEQEIPKNETTILLGDGGKLDSMGYVNFVVALEDEYARVTGKTLNLAERLSAANSEGSRVTTVGQLIDFLQKLPSS